MATAVLQLESFARESATAPWRALLNGDARQQAWTVVHEIAAALAAEAPVHGVPPSSVPKSLRDEWPLQKHFFWKAEAALFYAYLEQAGGAAEFAGLSYAYLNAAIDEAAAQPSNLHLRDGLTKIGWVLAHFARLRHCVNTAESCAALDEVLHEQLSQADWQGSYDLGTGLTGYGVYALERGPEAAPLAVKVFHWLRQTAEHQPEGTTWQMQAAWCPKEIAVRLPESFYCLGKPGVTVNWARALRYCQPRGAPHSQSGNKQRWTCCAPAWHGAWRPRKNTSRVSVTAQQGKRIFTTASTKLRVKSYSKRRPCIGINVLSNTGARDRAWPVSKYGMAWKRPSVAPACPKAWRASDWHCWRRSPRSSRVGIVCC
jgi:hypothetical protein